MHLGFALSPYAIALVGSILISLLVGSRAWYGSRTSLAYSFALMETGIVIWSLFKLVQLLAGSSENQIEAFRLQFLGIAMLPGSFYAFARALEKKPLTRAGTVLAHLPGIILVILSYSNEFHGLGLGRYHRDRRRARPSARRPGLLAFPILDLCRRPP